VSRTWICVSATREEAAALVGAGPRRDFVELAERLDASVIYREGRARRGWRGRLLGPHLRQAWNAAERVAVDDRIFADGEHVGLPLLIALAVRRRHPLSVVMIGHMPSRWWKRALFALTTRLGIPGTLLVHSRRQERLIARWLGPSWRLQFLPYQVDTEYWIDSGDRARSAASILAVGSEQRDYETLVEAVRGLPASLLIAAGSYWAREVATNRIDLPSNVTFLTETLPFRELRERYQDATIVAVTLKRSDNQAGVTTLLEAMSARRAVVVTATLGQTDVVTGPLVTPGDLDVRATAERGPRSNRERQGPEQWSGLYVREADVDGLRAAFTMLLNDMALRSRLSAEARKHAETEFSFEAYVDALADSLGGKTSAAAVLQPGTTT
jgi:glycosyltransferase involved in cell wall biosynthesis